MEPTSLPGILNVEGKLRLRHGVFYTIGTNSY